MSEFAELEKRLAALELHYHSHYGEQSQQWKQANQHMGECKRSHRNCLEERGKIWRRLDWLQTRLGLLIFGASALGNLLMGWLIWKLQQQGG